MIRDLYDELNLLERDRAGYRARTLAPGQSQSRTTRIVNFVTVDTPAYTTGVGFDSVWLFSWEAQGVVRLPIDDFWPIIERRQ